MIIFLIGFMGSGKSTLGKRLARKISYDFQDMDSMLEQQEGMTVVDIFAQKGEAYFRKQERLVLESFVATNNVVVATGGGAPCNADNMELMNSKGVTVYLKMNVASLVCRLEKARVVRPLLKGMDQEQLHNYITRKMAEREPYYSKAHCIIKGESVKPDHVISLVFGATGP